jgi:hypothetical protein
MPKPKKAFHCKKKISFATLYAKFKFKVIRHFFFSTVRVVFSVIISTIIANLFKIEGRIINYNNLLPEPLQKFCGVLNHNQFVIGGIVLVLVYACLAY